MWTYWASVSIPTYPFAQFLRSEPNALYGMAVSVFNRAAYAASAPAPSAATYQTLVVENAYLRLTFLPELGGRLYQCLFKPTNQVLFYNNAVIKPSYWGPLSRDENWWLAAGGLEWAFPVNEHGYAWGLPWKVSVRQDGSSATVLLRSTEEPGQLQAEIAVSLAAGESRFTVEPRLTNGTERSLPVQFWANAMLAPGSDVLAPEVRFEFPTQSVIVHSTGDASLPPEGSTMPWPLVDGRDLGLYQNWQNWLGVFATEPLPPFAGLYNAAADIGLARVLSGDVGGVKLFAFGSEFADLSTFSDNGSAYAELWVGSNRTFWPQDDVMLGPGETLSWREVWVPVAGIGGYTVASSEGVLRLERDGDSIVVGAFAPRPQKVALKLVTGGEVALTRWVLLEPAQPYMEKVMLAELGAAGEPVYLLMFTESGILMAQTGTE